MASARLDQILWAFSLKHTEPPTDAAIAPAQEAITYETKTLNTQIVNNPFSGDPRPEHDKAWTDILKNSHTRFSEEELHRLNQTSLALKDGGYIGELGVYHELHCVKWIRKWIHRDHYWPALKGAMLEERKNHIDHCLEMMRLNAMCRGSLSVTTFRWVGSLPNPVRGEEQECIDWEKLDSWSSERRLDLSNLDVLKDRPEPQDWELIDPDVRLGAVEGDVDRFAEALKNAQNL